MSHSQVAHRWFHQVGNQRTGENYYANGNMFYAEKIIYSYGKHFAIAIRFDDLVLFNVKGYSSSTSKHQGHVLDAIDTYTHDVLNVPFKEGYRFDYNVSQKEVFKYIDYADFVHSFESNIKKLENARKPELYTTEIERLQKNLSLIFSKFRGSKTYALKTKGMRKLLNFEVSEEMLQSIKEARKKREAKKKQEEIALRKRKKEDLLMWEAGKGPQTVNASRVGYNTLIRVKDGVIQTSKGMELDLVDGVRVFKFWLAGKALGIEIESGFSTFKCTKANGVIKFGCHEVDFEQAKRVLTPYL